MTSFLFRDITALDGLGLQLEHASVGVRDGKISWIAENPTQAETESQGPWDTVYEGSGKVLLPGFYNAHAHVPMTLLRGRGENLVLDDWLNKAIFPFEAHIDDEAAYWATLLGIAEMLRFGTVSFSDMYYNSDARSRAVVDSGIKCNLGHSLTCFDPNAHYTDLPDYAINNHLLADYHGAAEGRLLLDANLHAEYTSTPTIACELAAWAKENNLLMQVHVSETQNEVEGCKQRHGGLTPVQYLNECGMFDVPALAAHCVWLEPCDYDILHEKGVTVALNPASNAKLGSGIADISALAQHGIALSLGTDGVASNNNHDMHRGMYVMALMQRARDCSATGLSSVDVIKCATYTGAQAQGRTDCGALQVGMRADLCVMDCSQPWMQPLDNLASGIIYSAEGSDVVLTMVDGSVLYQDGEYPTIDIEQAIAQTNKHRQIILEKMGEA